MYKENVKLNSEYPPHTGFIPDYSIEVIKKQLDD